MAGETSRQKSSVCQNKRYPIRICSIFHRETDANYAIAPHTHRYYQWYVVLHGEAETLVNGQPLRLKAEQSVLVPPGVVRAPHAVGKALGYLVMIFENIRLTLPADSQVLACPPPLRPELHSFIRELHEEQDPDRADMLLLLAARLLVGLRRSGRPGEKSPPPALNETGQKKLTEQVDDFMRRNLQNPLSRQDLAEAMNLSSSHLARTYRAAAGKTLLERLTELRLNQACALLLESTLPITEISLEVGFNSFSHFTALFKRHFRLSPSTYRRSAGCVCTWEG